MQEELDAVLALASEGTSVWERKTTDDGYVYYIAEFEDGERRPFRLVASTAGKMGPDAIAAHTIRMLERVPRLAGMVGVCAGRRAKELEHGDVVAADMAFRYDTGKNVGGVLQPQMVNANPHPRVIQWLNDFRSTEVDLGSLASEGRPPSLRYQKEWILFELGVRLDSPTPWPESDAEIADVRATCPSWERVLERLTSEGLVELEPYPRLTADGLAELRRMRTLRLLTEPRPDRPEPLLEIGSFATAPFVVEDDRIFDELAAMKDRKVLALDMEAAAFIEAALSKAPQLPTVVMKGVSDFADSEKDDGSRSYAKTAAARAFLAFAMYALPLIGDERPKVIGELIQTLQELDDPTKALLLDLAASELVLTEDFAIESDLGRRLIALMKAGLAVPDAGGPWRAGSRAALTTYAKAILPIVKQTLEGAVDRVRDTEIGTPMPEYRVRLPRPALTYEDRAVWRRVLHWPDEYEALFEGTFGQEGARLDFLEIANGEFLVEIVLTPGWYQPSYLYAYLDERTDPPTSTILTFRRITALTDSYDDLAESQEMEVSGLPSFDPASRNLVIFHKSRGIGDCGDVSTYRIGEGTTDLVSCRVRMCDNGIAEGGTIPEPDEWPLIDVKRTYRSLEDALRESSPGEEAPPAP